MRKKNLKNLRNKDFFIFERAIKNEIGASKKLIVGAINMFDMLINKMSS
jgi:hypothetical protein